ncbi:MAG TPA: hypothetical protein VMS65_12380 [Polyangiaceae bacterium]|nr:hypothetical protein [Polyangiaceae bacterium]
MSELSSDAKALIRRVGFSDGPRSSDRARVKRRIVATIAGAGTALGGGGTIASGAPAAAFGAAAASKVTLSSVVLWLAVGAGFGSAVSAPAVVSAYRQAETSRASAPISALAPVSPKLAERPNESPRAPTAPSAADEAVPAAPSLPAPAERRAADVPGAVPTGAASLAEETRLLQAAQRELARKNTSVALALLDEHATRFPRGALAQERSAARVLALCDLGRSGDARRAAQAFIRSAPQSPLVPRLRASCALAEPAPHGD